MARKIKEESIWEWARDNITFIIVTILYLRDPYANHQLYQDLAKLFHILVKFIKSILL